MMAEETKRTIWSQIGGHNLAITLPQRPALGCVFCGGKGWVWEPHWNSPIRHKEACPAGCSSAE